MATKLYFDDPEGEGPSRETSHPNFVKVCSEKFYYDCTDEFSPFGNDDGADTLANLEEWYQDNGNLKKPLQFIKELMEENWGIDTKYMKLDKDSVLKTISEEEFMLNTLDNSIIATAFGQYKIEGALNPELKELAILAIERQKTRTQYQIDNGEMELRKLSKVVDGKTTTPDEHGGMKDTFLQYLTRLEKMKSDLQKIIT
jgi:uncharacterized protein YfeS